MSWKFNPPPGWPQQPEGWQPPPGWAPDPTWPPAPPGWQFWVPADTPPTTPTYQTPTPAPTSAPTPTPTYSASPYQSAPTTPQSPGPYPPGQQPYPGSPGAPGAYPQPGYAGGYGQPGYPTTPKPWYQRGGVIALGVAVLVLLTGVVGVGTFLLLSDDDPDTPPVANPSPGPTTSASAGGDDDGGDDDDNNQGGDNPPGPGQRFEGRGSDQIQLDLDDGVFYTVTITHEGGDWFEVYSTDGDEDVSNLAWGIGDHQGTYAINMFQDEDPDGIRIETSGSWTIELRELSESPGWPDNSDGVGSTVLLVDPDQGDIDVTGTHDGESNFIIWAYVENGYPSLLFNEIGPHEGDAVVPANTFALTIIADGNWTLQQN